MNAGRITMSPTESLYALRSGVGGLTAGVITVLACSAFVLGAGPLGPWRSNAAAPQAEKLTGQARLQIATATHSVHPTADARRRSRTELLAPIRPNVVHAHGRTPAPAAVLPVRSDAPRPVPAPQTIPPVVSVVTDADAASAVQLPPPPTLPDVTVPSVPLPPVPVAAVTVPSVTTPPVTVPSVTVPSLP